MMYKDKFEGFSLVHAYAEHGTELKVNDDGEGPVWIFATTYGIDGVIRARSWEYAYDTALCEFCPIASHDDVIYCFDDEEKEKYSAGEIDLPDGFSHNDNGDIVHLDYNAQLSHPKHCYFKGKIIWEAEFRIPVWAVCFLEYGDNSALNETEIKTCEEWLSNMPNNLIFSWGEESFGWNDLDNDRGEYIETKATVIEVF